MTNEKQNNEFVITRTFDAPQNLVWKAYTEQEHLTKWWGPKGTTTKVVKLDFRVGGIFHYCMNTTDGHKMWGKFIYREIVPQTKLVFVVSFSDESGGFTRHPMAPTWPLETLNTVTFSEHNGKTTITITGIPINASAEEQKIFNDSHQGMTMGFTGTYNQLEEYLATLK
jgi:uncharacterized protein YndB with AHSA1/START domain